MKESAIRTNLLPREIMKDRMIRAKKPWAVGAAAALLLGCTISYFGYWRAWNAVLQPNYFAPAVARAKEVVERAKGYESSFATSKDAYKKTSDVGQSLVPSAERRERWLEVWKTLNLWPTDGRRGTADGCHEAQIIEYYFVQGAASRRRGAVVHRDTRIRQSRNRSRPRPTPRPLPSRERKAPRRRRRRPSSPPRKEAPERGQQAADGSFRCAATTSTTTKFHLESSKEGYVRRTFIKSLKAGKIEIPEKDRGPDGPSEIDIKKLGPGIPRGRSPLPVRRLMKSRGTTRSKAPMMAATKKRDPRASRN